MQQCNVYTKREKITFVIHAFICNENNLIFNSKLAIYHQYINSIGEDRIPTSNPSHQIKLRCVIPNVNTYISVYIHKCVNSTII